MLTAFLALCKNPKATYVSISIYLDKIYTNFFFLLLQYVATKGKKFYYTFLFNLLNYLDSLCHQSKKLLIPNITFALSKNRHYCDTRDVTGLSEANFS